MAYEQSYNQRSIYNARAVAKKKAWQARRNHWRRHTRHKELAEFFRGGRAHVKDYPNNAINSSCFFVDWKQTTTGNAFTDKFYSVCHTAGQHNKYALMVTTDFRHDGFIITLHSDQLIKIAKMVNQLHVKDTYATETDPMPEDCHKVFKKAEKEAVQAVESVAQAFAHEIDSGQDPDEAIF